MCLLLRIDQSQSLTLTRALGWDLGRGRLPAVDNLPGRTSRRGTAPAGMK